MKETDKHKAEKFVDKIYQEIKEEINDIFFGKVIIECGCKARNAKNGINLRKTLILIAPIEDENYYSKKTKTYIGFCNVCFEYNLKGKFDNIQMDVEFNKRGDMQDFIPKMIKINSAIDKISKIIKDAYDKNIIEFKKNNPNINLLI